MNFQNLIRMQAVLRQPFVRSGRPQTQPMSYRASERYFTKRNPEQPIIKTERRTYGQVYHQASAKTFPSSRVTWILAYSQWKWCCRRSR